MCIEATNTVVCMIFSLYLTAIIVWFEQSD